MFRGPATLMRTNPQIKWVFGGGMAAGLLLVPAALFLLPGNAKVAGVMVLSTAMVAIYPMLLSRALKPKPVSVALYVDDNGVYADDAPLALRKNIAEAYLRPALDARRTRITDSGTSFSLDLPQYPLTVELKTRSGRQINIDPGGQEAGADILTALGFPVAMCAADYRAKTTSRQWVITAVVVVLFFAALFGFSLYKQTGH